MTKDLFEDFIYPFAFQALAAQKFREQQEGERRRHLEEMRSREAGKLTAVFERRKAIETATAERKEAMLKRAQASMTMTFSSCQIQAYSSALRIRLS